ncbi:TIGR00730 family Rossman fold protein [Bacteroidota bacterium]
MKSICVFCGSSIGNNHIYKSAAIDLGKHLAEKDITLVYGGGNIGLMGVIANSALKNNGKVIGVIPQSLQDKELAHEGVSKMYVVKSMHERKALMAQISDAFVALPGGFGTFDELFESLTWNQLEIMNKPIAVYNINGYFDFLIKLLKQSVAENFLRKEHYKNLIVASEPEKLIQKLKRFKPAVAEKWIEELKKDID